MMRLWNWQPGRQGSGYDIFTLLWSTRLRLDCYLIRYRTGAFIGPHRDPVRPGEKHWRANLILWPARAGGELVCERSLLRIGPLNVFRPDLALHAVSEVTRGTRIVFSVGWKTGRAHAGP